jgi:ABC-type oligopeptide transport system ATPase subunit
MNQKKINLLFSKLRQPIHIDYICEVITKDSYENTKKILQEFVDKGKIEEIGKADDVFNHPQSNYTRKLLGAIPGKAL